MNVNVNKLKGKMAEKDVSVPELAKIIGMYPSTLYRKLADGGRLLLVKDANAIVDALHLTVCEAMEIFFSKDVARHSTA